MIELDFMHHLKGQALIFCFSYSIESGCICGWSYELGDNSIHNFHLGRCIVRYTSKILFYGDARPELSKVISYQISDDRPYIRQYTFPNENFEYGYPNSNAFLQFLSSCSA